MFDDFAEEFPGHRLSVVDLRPICDCGWAADRYFPTTEDATTHWLRDHAFPAVESQPPNWLVVKSDVLREQVEEMITTRPEAALKLLAEVEKWHRPLTTKAVQAARHRGASWTDVGSALGVSRQAAHERFRALEL
ncbi:AsnC family protein [Actinokineospora auranticolor]|uniref:Homeodomain-like domain-containing protein n=1 Tax=Actinokineospora auranticolor TaxID=155976 RepID=A0A2S6GWY9_9PSEU|nr:AsnC family protein [Actinokineospora auranticolor]PPK69680.1 hypothetical protein CLV40_103290 [Actinokineospora auranticolor]